MKCITGGRETPVAFGRGIGSHNTAERLYEFLVNLKFVALPVGLPFLLFREVKTHSWNNNRGGGGNDRYGLPAYP
jgi:hypothetical protein